MVAIGQGIGAIEELGPGVTTDYAGAPVKKGDLVYWVPLLPCYRCYDCTVVEDVTQCDQALAALFRPAEQPPFDGPEMKYRFARALERDTGASIIGYRL